MVDFNKLKWDNRFIHMAFLVSKWSKDPSTQVGAVIADDRHRVVSIGYNGFPKGMNDDEALYANREVKYERIIHGEINALMNANRSVEGCTLYLTPFFPCPRCTVQLIQAGIKRIVYVRHDSESPFYEAQQRWDNTTSLAMCKEAGIQTRSIMWRSFKNE